MNMEVQPLRAEQVECLLFGGPQESPKESKSSIKYMAAIFFPKKTIILVI